MPLLQKLGTGQGYLKAGFLGFAGSGKTWTSMLLAIGVRKLFGLSGPLALFDTEGGSEYIAPVVRRETGTDLLGLRSRSFDDLVNMTREAEKECVSVLMADSVTHVWREVCDAYLKQVNERRSRSGQQPRSRLEFQDWAAIKAKWATWTDLFLNSKLHVIIAGRAGFEWDFEEKTDDSGETKKELVKTGIKMKTETEFGFEPSLLVEMDRIQVRDGKKLGVFVRRATVLKDRFGVIDATTADDPTFEFFRPHVEMLKPGAHAPIDTEVKSDLGVNEEGDSEWQRERRERAILCEEIQGLLMEHYPGQTTKDKQAKAGLLHKTFDTRSWTKVETLNSGRLREGLESLRSTLGSQAILATPAEEAAVSE